MYCVISELTWLEMDRLFICSLKNYYQKYYGSKLQKPDSRQQENLFLNLLTEHRKLKASQKR